jgi:hypothetical protein
MHQYQLVMCIVIVRKFLNFIFNVGSEYKTAMTEILFNIQDLSSIRMPTQSIIYSQICFTDVGSSCTNITISLIHRMSVYHDVTACYICNTVWNKLLIASESSNYSRSLIFIMF